MQHHVGPEVFAQIAIEGRKGVGRGEAALEQEPHRVALVAHRRLHADQHLAEPCAEHEDRGAVRLVAAGGRSPLRFDLGQMRLASDVIVVGDARDHVGRGSEPLRRCRARMLSRSASTESGASTA